MPLTLDEIMEAIEAAPNNEKVAVAERLMDQYEGDDKAVVEPDILSSAIVSTNWDFD